MKGLPVVLIVGGTPGLKPSRYGEFCNAHIQLLEKTHDGVIVVYDSHDYAKSAKALREAVEQMEALTWREELIVKDLKEWRKQYQGDWLIGVDETTPPKEHIQTLPARNSPWYRRFTKARY